MEFIKKHIVIVILVLILICFVSFFLIREYIASKTIYMDSTMNDSTYEMIPKTYNVNEYTNIIISDADMAQIYLDDYINNIGNDMNKSYYLLDEEYRVKKFGSLENYINYLNNLNYQSYNVEKYYKKDLGKYIVYGVYDQNGNFFAFKTEGVMQYSVYLDDYTVEIW